MELSLFIFISILACLIGSISILAKESYLRIIAASFAGIIFILSGINALSDDLIIYSDGSAQIISEGWISTLYILLGTTLILYNVVIIYNEFNNLNLINYKGHG